ncbi:MAG: hypothetical protein KDD42_10310, partial [Bdellovibrionales bacterium]|nr:hypothetical protein [Bdellovibrionales bacterium]
MMKFTQKEEVAYLDGCRESLDKARESLLYQQVHGQIREPVISKGEGRALNLDGLRREWIRFTAGALKAVIQDPVSRESALSLSSFAVSESLPLELVNKLAVIKVSEDLKRYLTLASVPDELLSPDVTHAPRRIPLEKAVHDVLERNDGDLNAARYDLEKKQRAGQLDAITQEEADLVIQRYRFARDVKLIVLAALLQESNS